MEQKSPGITVGDDEKGGVTNKLRFFKSKKVAVAVSIFVAFVIVITSILHFRQNKNYSYQPKTNPSQDHKVDALSHSTSLDDKRALISLDLSKNDYQGAEEQARQISEQTNSSDDNISLLRICVVYEEHLNDSESCVGDAVKILAPIQGSLGFRDAYTVGSLLEKANHKQDAKGYYQRAYDAYDSSQADEYTMSKDKLKQHINELH